MTSFKDLFDRYALPVRGLYAVEFTDHDLERFDIGHLAVSGLNHNSWLGAGCAVANHL